MSMGRGHDYTMFSHGPDEHTVSWPDGASVLVKDNSAVAMQIGAGRAMVLSASQSARALADAARRLSDLVVSVETEVKALIDENT